MLLLDLRNKAGNRRGYSMVKYLQLQDRCWLFEQYVTLKKHTTQIARELGCANSTVYTALIHRNIPVRSTSEAITGRKLSKSHLENVKMTNRKNTKRGSEHWNWQGGKNYPCDRKSWQWKEWRRGVYQRDNYICRGCEYSKGGILNPHHILPVRDFPHLKYSIDNGITLCKKCHEKTMNKEYCYIAIFRSMVKGGELLGHPERTISSQAEVGILPKVQRLEAESRTDSNASTSAVHESDDIVCSLQECKEVQNKESGR